MSEQRTLSRRAFLSGTVGLTLTSLARGADGAPTAREVMQRSFDAPKPDNATFKATMTLESPSSAPRVRSMTTWLKRLEPEAYGRSIVFLSPASLARTATLTVERTGAEDDMWVFLPAMRKTRRLVSSNRRDAYIGSDFSFGDILGHKVGDWRGTFGDDVQIDGKACWVIDNEAASARVVNETGYGRMRTVIAKDSHCQVAVEYFDATGDLLKKLVAGQVKCVDAVNNNWQAMEMRMENVKTGHVTTIVIADYDVRTAVPEARFKANSLDR